MFFCWVPVVNWLFKFKHRNGPYELQAAGEQESVVQKLNRLKCEVVELQQEIQKNVIHSISKLKKNWVLLDFNNFINFGIDGK